MWVRFGAPLTNWQLNKMFFQDNSKVTFVSENIKVWGDKRQTCYNLSLGWSQCEFQTFKDQLEWSMIHHQPSTLTPWISSSSSASVEIPVYRCRIFWKLLHALNIGFVILTDWHSLFQCQIYNNMWKFRTIGFL